MFPGPWLLLCMFGVLIILGATSGIVNARLWISEPLAAALVGIALGPVGVGLIRLDPLSDPTSAIVLRETARVTLAIVVTARCSGFQRAGCARNGRAWRSCLGR